MKRTKNCERKNWCKRSKLESLTACVCALTIAFLLRSALHIYVGDRLRTLAFTIVTIFVADRYGYRWAIGTLFVGFIVSTYYFVKPYGSIGIPDETDLYRMIYYFGITTLIVLVVEKTNRDKYESELYAKASDERYRKMVALDKELREQHFKD